LLEFVPDLCALFDFACSHVLRFVWMKWAGRIQCI
jgi:hypothetical protein